MTDLSRVKLKGTHLSPEKFFRWLDGMYSVHDLRVNKDGWIQERIKGTIKRF